MERSRYSHNNGRLLKRLLPHGLRCIVGYHRDTVAAQIAWMMLTPFFSFFSEVLRIGSPGYLPNDTDVLCARQRGVDVTETKFTMGGLAQVFFLGTLHTLTCLHFQNAYIRCWGSAVTEKKVDSLF
jgi:hypothetical protein